MKKIGNTLAGTVIVEMSPEQFAALELIHAAQAATVSAAQSEAVKMTLAEKAAFVRAGISKSNPRKRAKLAHFISNAFRLKGGIGEQEVQEIIALLQREKFLVIDDTGRVSYSQG